VSIKSEWFSLYSLTFEIPLLTRAKHDSRTLILVNSMICGRVLASSIALVAKLGPSESSKSYIIDLTHIFLVYLEASLKSLVKAG
jgi:hypothetical protein